MVELDAAALISQVGFPIAAYLLFYFDLKQTVRENTQAITKLADVIAQNRTVLN